MFSSEVITSCNLTGCWWDLKFLYHIPNRYFLIYIAFVIIRSFQLILHWCLKKNRYFLCLIWNSLVFGVGYIELFLPLTSLYGTILSQTKIHQNLLFPNWLTIYLLWTCLRHKYFYLIVISARTSPNYSHMYLYHILSFLVFLLHIHLSIPIHQI